MLSSRCCGQIVHMTQSVLALNNNLGRVLTGLANRLFYSKDKGGKCCENVPQTYGKKVEPWPKPDPPPPMWRCECPQDPQPPNYDPYRIKVPDVVVPPMPPSNAKWSGVVHTTPEHEPDQQQGCQQQQQNDQTPFGMHQQPEGAEEVPVKEETFMGLLKGFFGRLRGKGKGEGEAEIPNEDARELFRNPEMNFQSNFQSNAYSVQDLFHNSPFVHPDYWKDKPVKKLTDVVKEVLPKLGYHGKTKYKYAFHEPWRPLDRMALLEQAEKQELEQLEDSSGNTTQTNKHNT